MKKLKIIIVALFLIIDLLLIGLSLLTSNFIITLSGVCGASVFTDRLILLTKESNSEN